jgi:hypothetical protein
MDSFHLGDEMLDLSWADELINKEKLYDVFYRQPLDHIKLHCVIANKFGNVIKMKTQVLPVIDSKVPRHNLVSFIRKIRATLGSTFKLSGLSKFHIVCEPDDIIEGTWQRDYTTKINTLDDVYIEPAIDTFHHLSTIFVLLKEKKDNNTTKRVAINLPNRKQTRRH